MSNARTYAIFALVVLMNALGGLTQTVVNSMLLGIQASFGTPTSISQWLTTIFMLVIGVTAPLVAYLSKRFEERTLMFIAIAFFMAGTLIDLLAPSFIVLFIGRIPQAVAAGIVLPLMQTVTMTRFPKGQSGTAMGIGGIALGFAPNVGPLVGGALVDSLGWRSYFAFLIIVLIIVAALTLCLFDHKKSAEAEAHFNTPSLIMSTLAFGGVLLAFTNAANIAFSSPAVWVPLAVGLISLAAFLIMQRKSKYPLINLDIFKSKKYTISFIAQNGLFASYMGITLILPLFIQNISSLGALEAGAVFIPNTIFAMAINPIAGYACDKIGARKVCVTGGAFLFFGALLFVFCDADTPFWVLAGFQTIRGIGVSALIAPLLTWGLSDLRGGLVVDGSSFFTTVRMSFASLGTALMMLAISDLSAICANPALGYTVAFAISAAFALITFVCCLVKVRD